MVAFYCLILYILTKLPCFSSTSVFNTEVSSRVKDFLSDYLTLVTRAAYGPYNSIVSGNVAVNLSHPIDTSMKLLYQSKITFPESSNIYIALENGLFYGYIAQTFQIDDAPVAKRYSTYYRINSNGSPGPYIQNATYDHRIRPWYKQIKAALVPTWTATYLSATTGTSVFNFGIPLFSNYSNPGSIFKGTISVAAYLTDVTKYLVKAYENTDTQVFIVDQATGQLMASTLGIPVNTRSSTGALVSKSGFLFLSNSTKPFVLPSMKSTASSVRSNVFQSPHLRSNRSSKLLWVAQSLEHLQRLLFTKYTVCGFAAWSGVVRSGAHARLQSGPVPR